MTKREFLNAIVTGTLTVKEGKTKDAPVSTNPAFSIAPTADGEAEVIVSEALIEFAKAEIEKLNGRNSKKSASTEPTKAQKENAELAATVIAQLEVGKAYTAKEVGEIAGISTQKATVVLKAAGERVVQGEAKVDGRTVKSYTVVEATAEVEGEDAE